MSPTPAEWREVYPDAVLSDRIMMAFITAGLEPPEQSTVDSVGYTSKQAAIIRPLISSATEQELSRA